MADDDDREYDARLAKAWAQFSAFFEARKRWKATPIYGLLKNLDAIARR